MIAPNFNDPYPLVVTDDAPLPTPFRGLPPVTRAVYELRTRVLKMVLEDRLRRPSKKILLEDRLRQADDEHHSPELTWLT